MKTRLFVAIAFLFLGLMALPALATTYYVDVNNGSSNDNNPGTEASPWRTISKANSILLAGDTVYVKAGTYTTSQIAPTHSGSSGSLITYQNYGSDVVTVNNPTANAMAILLDGKSYVVVQGIIFTNMDYFCYIRNSANHNTVAYCSFTHPHLNGKATRTWAGSRIYGNSTYNWIHHCTFADYGYMTNDDIGSNFEMGDTTGGTDMSGHTLFENNTVYHGGHELVAVYSMYNVIRNNYFHHEVWAMGDSNADRGAVLYGDRCLSWMGPSSNSGRSLFEGNRVAYSGDPPDQVGSAGMSMNTSYNIIRKNYFCHNDAAGISLSLNTGYQQNIYYNKIYNNTLFHNGIDTSAGCEHCGIFFAYYGGSYYINYNVIKNNLLYKHTLPFDEYNQRQGDRKGIIAVQTFANNWNGDAQGDPKFVNASTTLGDPFNSTLPDMRLLSNSPCKEQGTYLTTITSSSGSGTTFTVADAGYFMDGWGIAGVQGDQVQLWGTSQKARCTSVNYSTNVITVDQSVTWTQNQGICLSYVNSAPDAGAYEYGSEDTTAPSAPATVRDGTGTDISTTGSTTQLAANWDASTDAESGISAYQYAIGTSAGGTQTLNWTTLGNVTTVTKTGLSLTNGQTYYFSVKAINGVGLTGNATNSNGQTVSTTDSTPPSAPATVRDGVGSDISTTNSTTQLSANWDASADAESGISGYQYAIGTSSGGTQTLNWTSLTNVLTVTKTGLTLSVGQTYFVSVRAINGAGLTGGATNSNGQTVVSGSTVIYFQDNFESWTAHGGAWSSLSGEGALHVLDSSTDCAKAGAKSLKLTDNDTTGTSGVCVVETFSPAISTDIYVRFFVYLPTGYESANSGASRRLLRVWCGGNRSQISLNTGLVLMEEIGGWSGLSTSTALSETQWHCIEMHVAPPSASTTLQLWVDGLSIGTLTANYSGCTTFDYMEFGDVCMGGGTNAVSTFYLDEVVVSNAYVGTGVTAPVTYFSDNFESWSVHGGAWSSLTEPAGGHSLNTSTTYAKTGTKSLILTDTDTVGTTGAYLTKNFSPAVSGDIYVRFYVFLPTGFTAANSGSMRRLMRVWAGGNRAQMTIIAAQPKLEEVGTWAGITWASNLSEQQWHCIEVHGTAPTATTLLEFWVDGVRLNANLMTDFSASSTWSYVELGDVVLGGGTNGVGPFYMDEAVISNSYVGP